MTFQGREITLENLSPVFTPEQEAAKRRELEQQLYEVFRKYADKRQSEEAGAYVLYADLQALIGKMIRSG